MNDPEMQSHREEQWKLKYDYKAGLFKIVFRTDEEIRDFIECLNIPVRSSVQKITLLEQVPNKLFNGLIILVDNNVLVLADTQPAGCSSLPYRLFRTYCLILNRWMKREIPREDGDDHIPLPLFYSICSSGADMQTRQEVLKTAGGLNSSLAVTVQYVDSAPKGSLLDQYFAFCSIADQIEADHPEWDPHQQFEAMISECKKQNILTHIIKERNQEMEKAVKVEQLFEAQNREYQRWKALYQAEMNEAQSRIEKARARVEKAHARAEEAKAKAEKAEAKAEKVWKRTKSPAQTIQNLLEMGIPISTLTTLFSKTEEEINEILQTSDPAD